MKAPEFILSQPWAMLPEHVETMLALADRSSLGSLEAVAAKSGAPLENARNVQVRDGVAVIPVRGVISRYANIFQMICGGTSVDVLARDIRTALDSPEVHAIVLEIDSPGGQAAGIGELASQIREGTKQKPIVSYVSNLGASAGYWLASAGSEVVASPSAMLGSVGVVWPMSRTTDDKETIEFVSSQSPNKRLSTETKDGRAKYQAMVDAMADVFIADVANNREMTPESVVTNFGAGGMLIGHAAVKAGMADRLGSLETLISELSHGGPAGSSSPFMHGGAADAGSKETPKMKFSLKSVLAALGRNPNADVIELDEADAAAAGPEAIATTAETQKAAIARLNVQAGPTDRERELEAQLEAALAAGKQAKVAEAEAWFAAQVEAGKALPAEKDATLAVYAALADAPPLLGSFRASYESRPKNGLTAESIPTDADGAKEFLEAGGFKVLPNAATTPDEAEAKESAARVKAMLAATEAGRDLAN